MVTRYRMVSDDNGDVFSEEASDGKWVRYEDHEAETKRLLEMIDDHARANKELADKIMDVMQELGQLKQAQLKQAQQIMEEDKEILQALGNDKPYCVECHDEIKPHDPGVCGNCYAMKYEGELCL